MLEFIVSFVGALLGAAAGTYLISRTVKEQPVIPKKKTPKIREVSPDNPIVGSVAVRDWLYHKKEAAE